MTSTKCGKCNSEAETIKSVIDLEKQETRTLYKCKNCGERFVLTEAFT